MNQPKFKIGDLVQLTEEGKRAFPTKILTFPWKVVSMRYEFNQWQIRVEHQGQRVNHQVRESLAEVWLESFLPFIADRVEETAFHKDGEQEPYNEER